MITDTDINILKSSLNFWDKLNESEQNFIINNVTLSFYPQSKSIYSKNNECIGIIIIKKGNIRTYILSEDGKEVTLYRLSENEVCVLSASCIIQSITFDVHICAESNCEALVISASAFSKITKSNIYAENFAHKIAVDRFSDVMWAMEQILFMSIDRRLAIFLIDESIKNNSYIINLTHDQIAKYMGTAREVVSRMLKYFENEGIVELSRGSVRLVNKAKLLSLTR